MGKLRKRLTESGTVVLPTVDADLPKSFVEMDADQQLEKLKDMVADAEGVANDIPNMAPELEKKASTVHVTTEIETKEQLENEEKREEVCEEMARKAHKHAEEEAECKRLLGKLELEIAKEVDRARRLWALENARKNALDSAYARYGSRANLQAIDAYYDGMVAAIDPVAVDVTDVISIALNNALHHGEYVQVLMTNGSIRIMDAEIANLLVESVGKQAVAPGVASKGKEVVTETGMKDMDEIPIQKTLFDRVMYFHNLMSENMHRQMQFSMVNPNAIVYDAEETRMRMLQLRGLPSVAQDYKYIQDMYVPTNGRRLPDTMYSGSMLQEMYYSERNLY